MNYMENHRSTAESIYGLIGEYESESGAETKHEVERLIGINGHDVAWVKSTKEGRDEPHYHLYCACDFAEDIGWTREGDEVYDLPGSDNCLEMQTALYLRQLELRTWYTKFFIKLGEVQDCPDETILTHYIPEIIVDLIDRQAQGDFIGSLGGYMPGGFVWPETVAGIVDVPMEEIMDIADDMEVANLVFVDGGAIRPMSAKDLNADYLDDM